MFIRCLSRPLHGLYCWESQSAATCWLVPASAVDVGAEISRTDCGYYEVSARKIGASPMYCQREATLQKRPEGLWLCREGPCAIGFPNLLLCGILPAARFNPSQLLFLIKWRFGQRIRGLSMRVNFIGRAVQYNLTAPIKISAAQAPGDEQEGS